MSHRCAARLRPSAGWYWAGVAALTLLGAGLRFADLSAKSVWLDEAFSVWMASQPLPDLWAWLARIDHHPPLYYILLQGWLRWFGDGPGAIRSLSALCSTLAIPFLAGAARTLGGRITGLAAALIVAMSPWQVRYAQEARMYGLLTLAVSGALYATARLWTGEAAQARRIGLWLLLAICQAAAMLAHNTSAALLPLAINLGFGGAWLHQRRRGDDGGLPGLAQPGFLGCWIAAQAAALLIWAVWLPGFWRQVQVVEQRFWIEPPTWQTVGDYGQMLAGGFVPAPLGWAALVLMAGLAGWGVMVWRHQPGKLWLVAPLLLTPPLVELLVSLRRPIFHLGSLIWTALPFYLLVAVGWTELLKRRRVPALVVATGLVVAWGLGLRGYFVDFQKERWDLAAAHVLRSAEPGDLVLFNASWVQLPFVYYLGEGENELPLELRGVPVDLFDRGELEPVMTTADLDTLAAQVQGRDRVWLVYSHHWYTDPAGLIPAELDRRFGDVAIFILPDIEVRLYTAPRPVPPTAPAYRDRDAGPRAWVFLFR